MNETDNEATQRRQAARRYRFSIAASTYLLWIGLVVWMDMCGFVTGYSWWLIGGIALTNAVFWTLFRADLNLRFREPSLSMPMMLVALAWAIFFAAIVPEPRGINLIVFLMVMLFGIFNLRLGQYIVCWMFAVAGYSVAVWATLPSDVSGARLGLEGMYLGLLAIILFWAVYFGYFVGRLRDRLAKRNNELHDALELVKSLAIHDDLTGVYNRRYLMEMLGREQQRALRHNAHFSLLMLDLDGFKEINDTKGHAAGDEVLRAFVNRLQDHVRGVDVVGRSKRLDDRKAVGRFGGEEFVAILPDTGTAGAAHVAERIRAAVSAEPITTSEGPVKLTVSIGVAEYQAGESVRDLLERVDRALYAAKNGGRNQVAVGNATSTDKGK